MGNVNLPTPVALAGGALCILAGYLLGVVTGPDSSSRTTATVQSYDDSTSRLCLAGDQVNAQEGAADSGILCGIWRHGEGASTTPHKGDTFRFVSMTSQASQGDRAGDIGPVTVIYGDVVP